MRGRRITTIRFMKAIIALVLALGLTVALVAEGAPDQPHMRAALELLQAAKESDNPLPMLRAARKHMVNAAKNKKGERIDAISAIDQAMAFATTGDQAKARQKIKHAISQVHSGMSKAN